MPIRLLSASVLILTAAALAAAEPVVRPMAAVPDSAKFTIRSEPGVYLSIVGIAKTDDGLVATYRHSDQHTATSTDIMVAYSADGGRTWTGHRSISHLDQKHDGLVWLAPQLSRLRDGRLVILVDRGVRRPGENWPALSMWQKPDRGMSNHLFWSRDNGKTWDPPVQIDDVGGEPSYILELSNGSLAFVRTESQPTAELRHPDAARGKNYYRAVAVFSDDAGKTWPRTSVVADSPLIGDCEVGLAEYQPGKLMAVTRVGDGGGSFGQPARLVFSDDLGLTWDQPRLSPFYAQRTIVRPLADGRLFISYRNLWGSPGSYAGVFALADLPAFEPAFSTFDESTVTLADDALILRTSSGDRSATYGLYPIEDDRARVVFEAELRVEKAKDSACVIQAGAAVRITPTQVCLADRPEVRFALDASQWHRYRIEYADGKLTVDVDGRRALAADARAIYSRPVRFGNRGTHNTDGVSRWRSIDVLVDNPRDHKVTWRWKASDGFPDAFRRSHLILLDTCRGRMSGDCGYSGWTQLSPDTVIVADYNALTPGTTPHVRAYHVRIKP